jgi:hypothetical protein
MASSWQVAVAVASATTFGEHARSFYAEASSTSKSIGDKVNHPPTRIIVIP